MALKNYDNFLGSSARRALAQSFKSRVLEHDPEMQVGNSSSYFLYDSESSPIKSTQQLNVDWSKFENHTFFSSAEVNVNVAFDNIINKFPFDGTRADADDFFKKLTGFERWVFDSFPRYRGALAFSSSYISVNDVAGALFPTLSKNSSGESVINPPKDKSLSIEAQIFIPAQPTSASVICQKTNGSTQGFSLHMLETTGSSTAICEFLISSGTQAASASAQLSVGKYNHVCAVFDRAAEAIKLYVSESLVSTSSAASIQLMDIGSSNFNIGSGSSFINFAPTKLFSGSLDELRVFHSAVSVEQQKLYAQKTIFATPELVLYYKFNEPPPPIAAAGFDSTNAIVLDSSGNSLHSTISNFSGSLRVDASSDSLNPMVYENTTLCPILFPAHPDVITLNTELLQSASLYDAENPNIITRLVPPHYLLEGSAQDGFGLNIDGDAVSPYSGDSIPGTGKLGSQQVLLSFLYMWAKSFDEMKMFVDSFSTLEHVGYSDYDTVPDNFLTALVKRRGLNLPSFFTDSTLEQWLEAENYTRDVSSSESPLRYVQSQLKRRILVSLPQILASKGTQHSIRAFLRAVGIDPNTSVRLREYGGPNRKSLTYARDAGADTGLMLLMGTNCAVVSPPLSSSRIEPGFPEVASSSSDGLLTSGSWFYEGTYKFPTPLLNPVTSEQSLVQLFSTGSSGKFLIANVTALPVTSSIGISSLSLDLVSDSSVSAPHLKLELPVSGAGIFDGRRWVVSFGCVRNDDPINSDELTAVTSSYSSSYYLRAASQINGEIIEEYSTSSLFYEAAPGSSNVLRSISAANNASGAYLQVGSGSYTPSSLFLNTLKNVVDFQGAVSQVRFWSRGVTRPEWLEHVRNYKSVGADDPLVNYNYVTSLSGSFGKLRLDSIHKQDQLFASGSGGVFIFPDHSEHGNALTGSGFLTGSSNFIIEVFDHSRLSPYFDEPTTTSKVRIRGFTEGSNIEQHPWATSAPVYFSPTQDVVTDDPRFSVDFSLVDSLNKEIVTMFSSYESMNDYIGAANLLFSPDYPDLERLRAVYFKRLSGPISFSKFFEFYRWFDTSIGEFIAQLLPKKTNFKGVNFTVEPHMLERGKHRYYFDENYRLLNSAQSFSKNSRVIAAGSITGGQVKRY